MAEKEIPPATGAEWPRLPDVPPREELAPEEWQKLFLETEGRTEEVKVSEEFIKAQRDSMTSRAKREKNEPPSWARKLIAGKASTREIIEAAAKRAERTPTKDILVEVYSVINELVRNPKNVPEIRKIFTDELIAKIVNKNVE